MAKLYPPYINGTIPAFYSDANQGTKIKVPFSMNKAVGVSEIKGIMLKIKSLNGTLKGVVRSSSYDATSRMEAVFDVKTLAAKKAFTLGSFYKIQIAYIDEHDEVGYYSTVGVIKYTTKPKVIIDGLAFGHINTHNYSYTGVYSQELGDTTEKMYSSHFTIYDSNNNIYTQSEEVLHDNTADDLRYEGKEDFKFTKDLELDKSYYIQFTATSINGMKVSSQKYRIIQRRSINPEVNIALKATMDFNNGYVLLTIQDDEDPVISGSFSIGRCDNANNWIWEQIQDFNLQSIEPSKWSLKDCTVEQGLTYRYSIQQHNENGIYSNRIVSNDVFCDFEDAFLYDGERQLKIRYNPKVSSFKTDIEESKTNTIGHQYPFITRNSHVYYKEFPISGLISYLSDEQELFLTKAELGIQTIESDSSHGDSVVSWGRKEKKFNTTTNLTPENIAAERIFKLKVLEWLNDGKPKSFRSPGEGNYLVRLMSVSLSPNDTVGRMLHSFSCQAYEIGEHTLENLAKYNISDQLKKITYQRRWATKSIADIIDNELFTLAGYSIIEIGDEEEWENIKKSNNYVPITLTAATYKKNQYYIKNYIGNYILSTGDFNENETYYKEEGRAKYNAAVEAFKTQTNKTGGWYTLVSGIAIPEIFVEDMLPGDKIRIDGEEITIGATGSYRVSNEADPFTQIDFYYAGNSNQGLITYSFDAEASSIFGTIDEISIEDIPIRQIIGTSYYETVNTYNSKGQINGTRLIDNVFEFLQDTKKSILKMNYIRVTKRPVIDAFLSPSWVGNTSFAQIVNTIQNIFLNKTINAIDQNEPIVMRKYADDDQPPFLLPLYQLRMPRQDYREEVINYIITNPSGDDQEFHYNASWIYKDYKPYTFEGYYIDKNMDTFAPYIGYLFDPYTGSLIKTTDEVFQFIIDDEIIDISEIQTWDTYVTSDIKSIILHSGVIGEFSYSQQIAGYSFDSEYGLNDDVTYAKRLGYERALASYLMARDGRRNYPTDAYKYYADGYIPKIATGRIAVNYNDFVNLKSYIDNPKPSVASMNTYLATDSNFTSYYNNLANKKASVISSYEAYMLALDNAIEQYKEANGIDD